MNKNNVILTGLPRGGTTLTCHLLNKVNETVALDEPMKVSAFHELGGNEAICDVVERFFAQSRESICTRGTATSKHVDGKIPDNSYGDQYAKDGLRKKRVTKGEVSLPMQASNNFVLCIKHCASFTAILENLTKRFPCYAIIRNPLSVLTSWNSVGIKISKGRAPGAERLDAGLSGALALMADKTERQLFLLSWFYEKYRLLLPRSAILYYEDIVASGGRCLSVITPQAQTLTESLQSQNKNKLYKRQLMLDFGEKLLDTEGAYWEFYSRESVQSLLQE